MSHREFDDALDAAPYFPHRSESDCWPDWPSDVEAPAVIDAAARQNTPTIVFGDMVRLLGMTFAIVAVIDLSLKTFLH